NQVTNNGGTALTLATSKGLEKVCEALISKMSPQVINQVTNNGGTALTLAASKRLEKVCEALISKMSPQAINQVTKYGETALTLAAGNGLEKICESLILKMSPHTINQITKYGETALTLAAGNGLEKVCEVLILKMSVQAIDSVVKDGFFKGHTALSIAKEKGFKNICDLLTQKSDKQNSPSTELNKQDEIQTNFIVNEENLYKVLQKMLEIQKLVENTADLYTHPISESIKEVINRDQITNDMLIDLAGILDKVLEEQTIINNHSCKERLVLFNKIAMDITARLDDDNTISSNNKAIMQNVMNKIIDRVANLTNISLIEKIITSITELKTGKITKGKLLDIEDEIEGFILEQTDKEANMVSKRNCL
ncbi:MAG: ankyrin repeat domain-containing protein, partial [Rickettsia endosymbiont of Graphium doson]|nr:ankyrin repeat domain-containing protein [Rickettsia endosymbiont of Graphium doson]